MKQHKYIPCLAALLCILACSCQKYDRLQPINGAAYIRLFNSIANYDVKGYEDGTVKDITSRRVLCVLVDPKQDVDGKWGNALITGDFLAGRAYDAAPYETLPNDNIGRYYNAEYPGAYRVRTGGVINGLDLERWEQITPGSHRLVIMRRLTSRFGAGTSFTDMTPAAKDSSCRVMIDTTVTLDEGGIYTLEILNQSMTDALPLQLRVRREGLDKERFATDSMYVNFYNYLQAPGAPAALDVYYQTEYVINTTGPLRTEQNSTGLPVSYSQIDYTNGLQYTGIRTPEQKLTTIAEKFATAAPYIAIPMPVADSFYYTVGPAFGQFRLPMDRPHTILNFYLPGQSAATGAKPYLQVLGNEYAGVRVMNIAVERLAQYVVGTEKMPLYQVAVIKGVPGIFPTVSTITLMSKFTAINQASGDAIAYQTGLQRPYEASFIQ